LPAPWLEKPNYHSRGLYRWGSTKAGKAENSRMSAYDAVDGSSTDIEMRHIAVSFDGIANFRLWHKADMRETIADGCF